MLNNSLQFSKAWFQKKILILVGILVILITIFLYVYAFRGFPSNPDTIMINNSAIRDGRLVLSGSTVSSAAGYSGYSYHVTDGKLMLKIRYVLVNHWHRSGDFRIVLSEKDLMAIQQVYIYSKGNKERLVWTRTDK
jgi:hypothetical protein